MATLGQIIYRSMITLIILFSAIIILLIALTFSGSLSEVTSSNKSPVANLGEDALLSCILNTGNEETKLREVTITWTKEQLTGDVYQYKDGAPYLQDQNPQFKDRTQLFTDSLASGNASLLLRNVRQSDEGHYRCSVSSSGGGGTVTLNVRVGAFSAPTFTFSDDTLTAEASRWLPQPNVTWSDAEGNNLVGNTSFTQNSSGIFGVVSTLQSVNVSQTYTCRIENNLVATISTATITETAPGVSANTFFSFSSSPTQLASTHLFITTSLLCISHLT